MDVVVADGAPGGRLAASPECPRRRSGGGAAPADRSVRARPGPSLRVRGRPAPPPRRPCPRPPRPVPLAELHARLARNRGGPSRQAQTAGPAGRWPPPPLQHRPHRPRGRRGRQRGSARRNRRGAPHPIGRRPVARGTGPYRFGAGPMAVPARLLPTGGPPRAYVVRRRPSRASPTAPRSWHSATRPVPAPPLPPPQMSGRFGPSRRRTASSGRSCGRARCPPRSPGSTRRTS